MKATKLFITAMFLFSVSGLNSQTLTNNLDSEIEQDKALMKSGDFKKAAEHLNQLLTKRKDEIKNHPRHAESWYLFSVSLRKLGRIELADKALERAKKLKETTQKEKTVQTSAAVATPTADAAADSSNDAPDITSSDNNATTAIATKTEAIEAPAPETTKTETSAGNSTDAYDLASLKNEKAREHHRKGCVFQEAGQWQAAVDEFLLATEAEPGNPELLEKTATILDQIGGSYYLKGQKIFAELEKASKGKLTAKHKAAWARANIYSSRPDYVKAEAVLKELLTENAENVEAIVLAAQLDSENKKYKEAIEKFEKAIKLDKSNMTAYLGLGDSYQKMSQFPKAIETLQQARALWPDSFMPLVSLGKAYLRNGDNGFALVMFNLAYEMNSDSFDVNLGLLEIFARKGDYRANLHQSKCEKVVRGDPRVEYWKAIFLEVDERPEESRKIYGQLAMYEDDIAFRAKLRIGQLYAGIGHETFPGTLLVAERPQFVRTYQNMLNQELAFAYLQEFLEKRPEATEAKSVRQWLDENEEAVRNAREFDALIQSQFSSNQM